MPITFAAHNRSNLTPLPTADVTTLSGDAQIAALTHLLSDADTIEIVTPANIDHGYITSMMSMTLPKKYLDYWKVKRRKQPVPEKCDYMPGYIYENTPSELGLHYHIAEARLTDEERKATDPGNGFRTILSMRPYDDYGAGYQAFERAWQTLAVLYFSRHFGLLACRASAYGHDRAGLIVNFQGKSPSSDAINQLKAIVNQYPSLP